ncbi:hypothetical protein EON66_00840 [archaeon]|nr:MAG: hypothetical protein EON66_00840 [archaeon]
MCWGLANYGATSVPAGRGPWRAISAGRQHTCAIEISTSAAVCWGMNNLGQSSVPAGRGPWRFIAAGFSHTCGIETLFGTAVCWGMLSTGATSVPSSRGPWISLTVGFFHTCGIETRSGAIVCWGNAAEGQATPPTLRGRAQTADIMATSFSPWLQGEVGTAAPPNAALVIGRGAYCYSLALLAADRVLCQDVLTHSMLLNTSVMLSQPIAVGTHHVCGCTRDAVTGDNAAACHSFTPNAPPLPALPFANFTALRVDAGTLCGSVPSFARLHNLTCVGNTPLFNTSVVAWTQLGDCVLVSSLSTGSRLAAYGGAGACAPCIASALEGSSALSSRILSISADYDDPIAAHAQLWRGRASGNLVNTSCSVCVSTFNGSTHCWSSAPTSVTSVAVLPPAARTSSSTQLVQVAGGRACTRPIRTHMSDAVCWGSGRLDDMSLLSGWAPHSFVLHPHGLCLYTSNGTLVTCTASVPAAAEAPTIPMPPGSAPLQLVTARRHACILYSNATSALSGPLTRRATCWGSHGVDGAQLPGLAGNVSQATTPLALSAAPGRTCVLLASGDVACHGSEASQLLLPSAGHPYIDMQATIDGVLAVNVSGGLQSVSLGVEG